MENINPNDPEFIRQQQKAMERMREMSRHAQLNVDTHKMPPVPPFVRVPERKTQPHNSPNRTDHQQPVNHRHTAPPAGEQCKPPEPVPVPCANDQPGILSSLLGGLNLPFLDKLKIDSDMILIFGLLVILWSEHSDRRLLLALLYILL